MGNVIRMDQYLERKAAETTPDEIVRRIAQISFELLTLRSEKNRLERILLLPPPQE